jgi:hypothetical protein
MTENEHEFVVANWVPPWIDGGKALQRIINAAVDNNMHFDNWLMLSLFLAKQLEQDMNRVRRQNLNISP